MIMKKSAFMLLIILLSLTANAQTPYRNEDGKKINKENYICKEPFLLNMVSLKIAMMTLRYYAGDVIRCLKQLKFYPLTMN